MRVAFVVPWFGRSIPGGAEAVVRELVRRVRARGTPVDVLTTCIQDFHGDWSVNSRPAGVEQTRFGPVVRFSVEPRNVRRFDRINRYMMFDARGRLGRSPLSPSDEEVYLGEQIRCPALIHHLHTVRDAYDAFVFMPYMFATTVQGIDVVREKGVLIPALHDESYAYMNAYRRMAEQVGAIVSQTPSEDRLIRSLWGESAARRTRLLGMGIDTDWNADAARFRKRFGIDSEFLLYAGRRDVTKGLYRLIWNYLEYRKTGGSAALVVIGPGEMPAEFSRVQGLINLGFVDRQSKYDAHAAAAVLVQPSEREAFSIVVLESWLTGRPVLVEGRSGVNRDHCLLGGGGLFYETTAEFIAALRWLADHEDDARSMVRKAQRYVMDNYAWPGVIDRFMHTLAEISATDPAGNSAPGTATTKSGRLCV